MTRKARRKTLRERAIEWTSMRDAERFPRLTACDAWLAGYRAGKRDGKAEAMKASGWES